MATPASTTSKGRRATANKQGMPGNLTEALQKSLEQAAGNKDSRPTEVIGSGAPGRSATGDNRPPAPKQTAAQKRAAAKQAKDDAKASSSDNGNGSAPKPKTEEKKRQAKYTVGATETIVWHPTAKVGTSKLVCPHQKYGHESEKAARLCISRLVRDAGYEPVAA